MTIDKSHISRVFSQKFSFQNQKVVTNYFEDEDLNEQMKAVVKEQWDKFEQDCSTIENLDHIFYKLYYTITSQNNNTKPKRYLIKRMFQIAAVLIVCILISSIFFYSNFRTGDGNSPSIEFISKTGFRNQFKLPDGTTGWLGYDSKLTYYEDEHNSRIIDLDGLAYFDVFHNGNQPFIVMTPSKLNIEVLGTRFNVSSYSGDTFCEVVLEKGSVQLIHGTRKIVEMIPSDRLVYNIPHRTFSISKANPSDYTAWKDGRLILNDVSLEEACSKLSRYYNVDFDIRTTRPEKQMVRLVLENETLDDALKLLSMLVPIKFNVEVRKILEDNSYSKKKIIITNK
jgi:ferric-dicitrate binding protein FerR (iron transport regulator)